MKEKTNKQFWQLTIIFFFGFINPSNSYMYNLSHGALPKNWKDIPERSDNFKYKIRIADQVDLSHNNINRLSQQLFGPATQKIFLNDNNITYIDPKVFRDLYNLSLLDLSNNRLRSFEIDFNFVKGQTKVTTVKLYENFDLTLLSK